MHLSLSSHFIVIVEIYIIIVIVAMSHQVLNFKVNVSLSLSLSLSQSLSSLGFVLSLLPCLELHLVYLMTLESANCLVSGDVDRGVVKSPPMSPPMPGWWEVGPNFDRCITMAM